MNHVINYDKFDPNIIYGLYGLIIKLKYPEYKIIANPNNIKIPETLTYTFMSIHFPSFFVTTHDEYSLEF
jgi:hypothetical protein